MSRSNAGARAQRAMEALNNGTVPARASATPDSGTRAPAPRRGFVPSPHLGTPATAPITLPNGTVYHPRQIGSTDDVAMLRRSRANGRHVLLSSVPGTGKTTVAIASFGEELLSVSCQDDTTREDFLGGWQPTEDPGRFRWVDGPLVTAAREGRPLLVDDVTMAPSRVLAVLYPVMDGRSGANPYSDYHGDSLTIADGFVVIGCENPGAVGTTPMPEPLASRFRRHITFTTDYDLARTLGVEQKAVTAAKNMEGQRLEGAVTWAPQMRELLAFRDDCDEEGGEFAVANLLMKAPEHDRDLVAATLADVYGSEIVPLTTGAQV